MYPELSPDENSIVYARSRTTSRLSPSDIWLVDRSGDNARLVTTDGTFPSFSADGKRLYFERQRKKVMVVDIDGSNLREIFPASSQSFKRYQVVKPRLSTDEKFVSFTSDKKGAWNVWYADLHSKKAHHIASGCEPDWFAGGQRLFHISKKNVLDGSGIFSFNISTGERSRLFDAGAPLGHEYFPFVTPDQRFLLFSASTAEDHSHITGNYQLFIHDLEKGLTSRITHDAFTNRWPKLIQNQAKSPAPPAKQAS